MQILSPPAILYLEDATPVLEEVITAYATWTGRSLEEKEALTRWVHDYAVGEDWTEEDSWADVSFTPEEIQAFSSHIWVPGDDGLPEWYPRDNDPRGGPRRVHAPPGYDRREHETVRPSSYFSTLKSADHDSPSK